MVVRVRLNCGLSDGKFLSEESIRRQDEPMPRLGSTSGDFGRSFSHCLLDGGELVVDDAGVSQVALDASVHPVEVVEGYLHAVRMAGIVLIIPPGVFVRIHVRTVFVVAPHQILRGEAIVLDDGLARNATDIQHECGRDSGPVLARVTVDEDGETARAGKNREYLVEDVLSLFEYVAVRPAPPLGRVLNSVDHLPTLEVHVACHVLMVVGDGLIANEGARPELQVAAAAQVDDVLDAVIRGECLRPRG